MAPMSRCPAYSQPWGEASHSYSEAHPTESFGPAGWMWRSIYLRALPFQSPSLGRYFWVYSALSFTHHPLIYLFRNVTGCSLVPGPLELLMTGTELKSPTPSSLFQNSRSQLGKTQLRGQQIVVPQSTAAALHISCLCLPLKPERAHL